MNLAEVKNTLEESLNQETSKAKVRNIVFWYDGEGEFVEDIKDLELKNSKILHLTDNNKLYIKYLLEKKDRESNYLIYSSKPRSVARENWLLDIEKYSEEFSTDKATVIMRDFAVKDESLRNVFKKYIKFFANKERYRKFASYNIQSFTEEKIDIGVLSTLSKLPMADFELVTKALLVEEIEGENKIKRDIKRFGDIDALWNGLEKHYGYHLEERNLEFLMVMFLITNLTYKFQGKIPKIWERFVSSKRSDTIVFIDHFMNHSTDNKFYNKISNHIGQKLNIRDYISKWDMEDYLECDTFKDFDDKIISTLIDNLVENIGEYENYRKIINKRRITHWFSQLEDEYNAIYYAMEILRLESELDKSIRGKSSYEMVENYLKSYYLFDTFYRKFYLSYDRINDKEKFYKLMEVVENTYTNWYLEEESIKWSSLVEEGLDNNSLATGLTKQEDFYQTYIFPHMEKDERVFVIISDGLRYEAAKEFSNIINRDRQGKAEVLFMEGVIPSYTKLGMAALLPHKTIDINEKGDVLVDGINSSGTANRQKVLINYIGDSLAIQYNEVKDMKRPEYKEVFEGEKLIYIYHNQIDAIGDKANTERDVFEAVEKTIEDLNNLIKNLINNLSATNIYITADHGFIYRRSSLEEFDKMVRLNTKSIEEGRRFILTEERVDEQGILSFPMKYLLGEDSNLHAIIPKGVNRFKIQGGGSNYVHGGASLQEIIIPIIKYKHIRKEEFKSSKVEVKLTYISRKITNRITYLEFFQTEKVEDKKIPISLKIYFADEEGNRISNENIIIGDSRSSKPEERTFREKFTLKDKEYDKSNHYYLILEDQDENIDKIYQKIPFMIDLAISNEFGF